MGTIGDKQKKGERIRAILDFVFGFKNRRGEILDWWIYSADGFSISPQEFYTALEKHLAGYKLPATEAVRHEFSEGGLLSDQRTYLRFMRERFAVETCAAPFGSVYFFSCRTVHVPALVRLWHILAAILFFNVMGGLLVAQLGFVFAIVATGALLFAIVGVMRNAGAMAPDLDSLLLRIPVVATIYEDWFLVETYYRADTKELYLKILPELIKGVAENVCAEKGVKLERQHQFPPVLDELYRPQRPKKETKPEE
ncbi:MAG TPA: hypothetical protein VG347_10695 [Verrucomicrobiae bacterium]|nr:hypothetical protein [Verrucomicrobiae bacterium]